MRLLNSFEKSSHRTYLLNLRQIVSVKCVRFHFRKLYVLFDKLSQTATTQITMGDINI